MSAPHFTIKTLRVLPPCSLELSYADGAVLSVDLKPIIRKHRTLARLADPAVFAQAKVGEWGGSVVWANDDDLALAADNLRGK